MVEITTDSRNEMDVRKGKLEDKSLLCRDVKCRGMLSPKAQYLEVIRLKLE